MRDNPRVTSSDGAIVFRRRGITIGEAYFDAATARDLGRVDLLRVVGAFSPPVEHGSRERHTLVIDLATDEDRLLEQMSKDTRYKIRRATKDSLRVAATLQPSSATVDEFSDFYDRFASAQSVSPAFRPRLHALADQGNLVLATATDEDRLLEQMSKDTRYQIRRAMQKDPVRVASTAQPSSATIDEFSDFYDRFASAQSVSPVFRPRLRALADRGNLVLTTASDEDGAVLVQHAYVAARARSYMLYSASVLAQSADSSARNLVGRANRYLHWHDIRFFRDRGYDLYDFGGLDVTGRSEKTSRIAHFKRGFGGEVRPVYSSTSARSLLGAAVQRILGLRGVDF